MSQIQPININFKNKVVIPENNKNIVFTKNISSNAATGNIDKPDKVAGYINILIDNIVYKVPYYNN